MPTTIPSVTPLPVLVRTSLNFETEVNAYHTTKLPTFSVESNAQAVAVGLVAAETVAERAAAQAAATAAAGSATLAAGHAADAATLAGAAIWVSGSTYGPGAVAYSPLTQLVYRRSMAATSVSTTDPALDGGLWTPLDRVVPDVATSGVIDCSVSVDFTCAVSTNTNLSFINIPPSGMRYACVVQIAHTGGVIGLPANTVNTNITPLVANRSHLFYFRTINGGARWYLSILPNFPL